MDKFEGVDFYHEIDLGDFHDCQGIFVDTTEFTNFMRGIDEYADTKSNLIKYEKLKENNGLSKIPDSDIKEEKIAQIND